MTPNAILERVNPLYERITSETIDVNCGDGRDPVELLAALYGKKFGGGPAFTWDYMVLTELAKPGSIQRTLPETHADFKKNGVFEKAKINSGVHSDKHAEGHDVSAIDNTNKDGTVGCGRWQKGQEISRAAREHIEAIIEKGIEVAPTLFKDREDRARQIGAVNADLAERQTPDGRPVLPTGREVVLAALATGDKGVVLRGDHQEEDAIYNLRPDETNNNHLDQKHFGMDGWLNNQFFDAHCDVWPFDPTDVMLQDVIMALATKLVLTGNLDNVVVRS